MTLEEMHQDNTLGMEDIQKFLDTMPQK